MNLEYEGCYSIDEPLSSLAEAGLPTGSWSDEERGKMVMAWKIGFEHGAGYVQEEWDLAEELRMESEAGMDW